MSIETYDVHLLLVQWPQRYPGEISPEVVDAVDEYVLEDNDEAWTQMVDKARQRFGDEVTFGRLIVTVYRSAIDAAVNPPLPQTRALGTKPVAEARTSDLTGADDA